MLFFVTPRAKTKSVSKIMSERQSKSMQIDDESTTRIFGSMNTWQEGQEVKDSFLNKTYLILKKSGQGGFGTTYLAQDKSSDELFVIKTSLNEDNDSIIKEWRSLIEVSQKLTDYEHIVNHKSLFKFENSWCIAMEYIEGETLQEYVRRKGILSEEEALNYIRQIGKSIQYLHKYHNLWHRDIKPSNIILRQNTSQVVLIDFGTARPRIPGVAHTRMSSPGYAPYEQIKGLTEQICDATDIYALAATLYYLLTGKSPIDAIKRYESKEELESPQEYNPLISDRVNSAIVEGMSLHSQNRPQSIEDWLELLPKRKRNLPSVNFDVDEQYSFTTETLNRGKTFYFSHDDEGEPIKLGDGSYGVVYQGHDEENNVYALKILYARQEFFEQKSIAEARFNAEIQSSKDIRRNLDNPNQNHLVGVINTLAGTKEFHNSPAYKTLNEKLKKQKLSNYALVMEKFEGTLEDYLEKGIGKYKIQMPEGFNDVSLEQKVFNSASQAKVEIERKVSSEAERKILKQKIYELTGYDILREMGFQERVATILPYLQDIAQGLNTLHEANYLHLDLKPGNIFIRGYGKIVQTVIGDLGFLEQGRLDPKSMLGNYYNLPLGTRHFKSPEQKEFYDIANVEISDDPERRLVIREPIFRDSIVEKGDYVIFSRNRHKAYDISEIEIRENQKNYPVYITLNLNEEERKFLTPGDRTQALFYKVQGKRTDLFGFGAIAFYLLTCGQSPVRFYESIHSSYDTRNLSVDNLITYYEQVCSFQSSEPELIKIFEPFKDKNSTEYAPIEIVRLILKCMLYKAQNTFFSACGTDKEPTEILLKEIINLYQPETGDLPLFGFKQTQNSLYNRSIKSTYTSIEKDFIEQLKILRSLSIDKVQIRFEQGFWYLNRLTKLIKSHLENSSDFYFAEVIPSNIFIKNSKNSLRPESLETKFAVYKNQQAYENDLRNDIVHTKIRIRNYQQNPYIPSYFSSMRREIILTPDRDKEQNKYLFRFNFSDKHENRLYIDDWIIIKPQNRIENLLFKIVNIDLHQKIIKLQFIPKESDDNNEEPSLGFTLNHYESNENISIKCIYYRNINPCIYYLHMLGTYIYDLFFMELGNNNYELIQRIYNKINTDLYFLALNQEKAKLKIKPLELEKDNQKTSWITRFRRDNSDNKSFQKFKIFKQILALLAQMYLKSTFPESEQSYYQSFNNDIFRIGAVLEDIDRLRGIIADLLDTQAAQLESLRSINEQDSCGQLLNLLDDPNFENIFSFHRSIDSQCEIEGEDI